MGATFNLQKRLPKLHTADIGILKLFRNKPEPVQAYTESDAKKLITSETKFWFLNYSYVKTCNLSKACLVLI